MAELLKYAHCSYCGHPFAPEQPWPRRCDNCGQVSFLNPLPVAVTLLPVDDGLLLIRRGIEPQKGRLALPGGFIEVGETWQEAAARELFEESGVRADAAQIVEFRVRSTYDKIMIFGLAPPLAAAELPPFVPNSEVTERVIRVRPIELAFPLHTEAMRLYLEG